MPPASVLTFLLHMSFSMATDVDGALGLGLVSSFCDILLVDVAYYARDVWGKLVAKLVAQFRAASAANVPVRRFGEA